MRGTLSILLLLLAFSVRAQLAERMRELAALDAPTNRAPQGRAVTVEWAASKATNIVDYLVQISSNRVDWSSYVAVPGTSTACTISNLFAPVWFRAIAVDADLQQSEPSNLAAWLGDTNDLFYYREEAASLAGPFQDKGLLFVKSNVPTQGQAFTRLRIEQRKRMVTVP